MFDSKAKEVKSPIYDLLVYLNEHDPNKLSDQKLQFLFKNIKNHFKKLIYSVALINKLQADDSFIKKHNLTGIVSVQLVEYCFYKISTIWDVSYQIAELLVLPKVKGKKKYDDLSKQFRTYSDQLPKLEIGWYDKVNEIRNRITHGGITINPYYISNETVGNRICFQAYNFELDDLIECNDYYSNKYNNNINFADNFFAYYTHLLYSYLIDLFKFIMLEITKDKQMEMANITLSNDPTNSFEQTHKTWLLSDLDIFMEITNSMVLLKRFNGNTRVIKNLPQQQLNEIVKQECDNFPFVLMQNISDGDWVTHNP